MANKTFLRGVNETTDQKVQFTINVLTQLGGRGVENFETLCVKALVQKAIQCERKS